MVAVVVALVVVGAALFVVLRGGDDEATDPAAASPDDLSEVEVYEGLSTEHVPGDVDYPQSPPVGGEHDEAWHECGTYDAPVREENMVHSLEHGTVWVTYRPGLSDDEIESIVAQLPPDSIVSPYDRPGRRPSSSPSGSASWPWTAPTTRGSRCSSRSSATGTPRRSRW